ncbi:MAG: helix-hairpin-helix domain-containing protein [bacterium]
MESINQERGIADIFRAFFAACAVGALLLAGPAAASGGPLDLNTATAAELAELPGIGASRAQAIVERRNAVPFAAVEELLAIRGIGDSVYAGLRERVVVEQAAEVR